MSPLQTPRRNVPAPNRPRRVGPAPNCPVAELAVPNRRRRVVPFRLGDGNASGLPWQLSRASPVVWVIGQCHRCKMLKGLVRQSLVTKSLSFTDIEMIPFLLHNAMLVQYILYDMTLCLCFSVCLSQVGVVLMVKQIELLFGMGAFFFLTCSVS